MPGGARVVLGVGGGIAAYKAVEVLRRLQDAGCDVRVVPTRAALAFVGEPTWAGLSGHPATAEVWDAVESVPHVRVGREADLVVVAPATADLLARAAAGIADDLLTNVLLTVTAPVVMAAAMHTEMWEHPATRANVEVLRSRGIVVLDPAEGRLAGGDSGRGRLAEPEPIVDVALALLSRAGRTPRLDLAGRRVVISAGGTREPVDPVRYLGNRASGRQGWALARAALARGAEVVLVAANVALVEPAGAKVVTVATALELRDAVVEAAASADAVVMAAAVADFRPAERSPVKLKKGEGEIDRIPLLRNPDVLAELAATPGRSNVVVGFAAETHEVLAHGRAKLVAKGCDLIVVNEVGDGRGFEVEHNEAVILGSDGAEVHVPLTTKDALAHAVWDAVAERLPGTTHDR